ncbi:MAG TPA: ABC transporter permease [Methylomirabilota bacterium]|nr:ABC transporter permease [Methylomirabilota bacterium]
MSFREVLRLALHALSRNKLRTMLTMLGMIIGVGAVICTVAIGEGAANQVSQQILALGDNMIMIFAGSVNQGGIRLGSQATKTLTVDDAMAVKQLSTISRVSPGVGSRGQLVYQNQNWATSVRGVSPDYMTIRHWGILRGSSFSQRDVDVASDVCLIGQTVAQNLFGDQDPVGQTIRVQNLPFLVIGEPVAKGQTPFGGDEDDTLIMPYTTVQKKLSGISWIQYIAASADSQNDIDVAETQIGALLRQRHHLRSDEDSDFIILSPTDLAQVQQSAGQVMTLLLASLASVSLVVGGIGIMNIMLVSVTERTREIGVRMAVGATENDVQQQFLYEAVVLSGLGGSIGVIAGVFGSAAISAWLQWPTSIPVYSIVAAVFFSAGVGVFFGFYPARKAARLDPIEALRYE